MTQLNIATGFNVFLRFQNDKTLLTMTLSTVSAGLDLDID